MAWLRITILLQDDGASAKSATQKAHKIYGSNDHDAHHSASSVVAEGSPALESASEILHLSSARH